MEQFSVVVTIVEGGSALEMCLAALAQQQSCPPFEVLVPYDSTIEEIGDLPGRYPEFQFLSIGTIVTEHPSGSAAGQHELFDRRRAAGLKQARGTIVAILEDRGVPRCDWAAQHLRLHATLLPAVIGGAVENGVDRLVNWAIYFSDFSRYQLPFAGAVVDWVTDVNISYRRSALEATRSLWSDRYHETTVHWELVRLGEELYLSPEPIVDQMRSRVSWAQLLSERYHWGRLFGYTRARECSSTQRLAYFCGSLLLPFLLLFRHAKMQFQKRKRFLKFLQAAPLVFVLALFWSFGEAHAYATSRA